MKIISLLTALLLPATIFAADVKTQLIVNSQSVPSITFQPQSGVGYTWYWQNTTGQTVYIEQADLYLYPGHGTDFVGVVIGGMAKGQIPASALTSTDPNNNVNGLDFILYERCVIPPDMEQHTVRKWDLTYQIPAGGWITCFAGGSGNFPVTVLMSISYSTSP